MDISINNLGKIDLFTSLFQSIKLFTDQISIDCNKERMYIQTKKNLLMQVTTGKIPSINFDTQLKSHILLR